MPGSICGLAGYPAVSRRTGYPAGYESYTLTDVNLQDSGEYESQVVYVVWPDIPPYLDGPDIRPVINFTRYTSTLDWNLQISGVNP